MHLRHVIALLGLIGSSTVSMLACSSTPTAQDYDQTCKADVDCVSVISGTCDAECNCPSSAISKKDQPKYLGDLERSGCHASACTCAPSYASCTNGTCALATGVVGG